MKITIEVKSLAGPMRGSRTIKRIASDVAKGETRMSDGRDTEVSIIFVGPDKIREINKKYRSVDCVTDVLSFSEADSGAGRDGYPHFLGELVICARQVGQDARDLKTSFEKELAWVIIHGMLHLFGYDHEKEADARRMRAKEKLYQSKIILF